MEGTIMNQKLGELLRRENVHFEILAHRDVYTGQERAAACHLSGRVLGKVVVVQDPADDWYALVLLPAAARLDLPKLRELTGRPGIQTAREADFARLFPDCEVGAMPPFGRLYGGLPVYVDRSLAQRSDVVFEAGTHHEEVRMPMREYLRIEQPQIAALTVVSAAA
jgi:Ala-tRNA(Pro) deacylase